MCACSVQIDFNLNEKKKRNMASFNIDGGYLEGLCRGFKCGILKQADYLNLVQCETLEGLYLRYAACTTYSLM